jgi:hypothetical protein
MVVAVHSGKSKMCVCTCHSTVTVGQHAEVYECLCLLRVFIDFCNFIFYVSSEIVIVVSVRNVLEV